MVTRLGYFPVPLPDESFYSLVSRYAHRVGHIVNNRALEALFGKKSVRLVPGMPSHMRELAQRLSVGYPYDANALIQRCTHYPAYMPFFPQDRLNRLYSGVLGTRTTGLNIMLGMASNAVQPPEHMQYCPDCVVCDREQYGEAYWRRHHQFPGVTICHEHGMELCPSKLPVSAMR
jgi:hypothetical protein